MASNAAGNTDEREPLSKLGDRDNAGVRCRVPSSTVTWPVDLELDLLPNSHGCRFSMEHPSSNPNRKPFKKPESCFFSRPSRRFACFVAIGLLFRVFLLVFSVWQDKTRWPDGQLRFTDVDYDVFCDAAQALVRGDDIYKARPTYRYSPLIAAIVAPGFMFYAPRTAGKTDDSNAELFFDPPLTKLMLLRNEDDLRAKIWGKLVFIFADILCAWLQFEIICAESKILLKDENLEHTKSVAAWLICLVWLLNPVTAVVSVRGNAEAVIGLCVLSCLLLVIRKHTLFAGVLFGLCVHLKLYPVIYAPAIYLWLSPFTVTHSSLSWRRCLWLLLPRWPHLSFGMGAMACLGSLTYFCFAFFGGYHFLHQAYFYHFTRVDIKHNFAPHFYPLYLLSNLEWRQSGLAESGTISDVLPAGTARVLFDRLQNTISSLMYSMEPGPVPFSSTIQSILQDKAQLHLMKLSFTLASLLPPIILILFLAFRLRSKPGLCWFATTFAFVTFNKVCTSQYFLWSFVILPIALMRIRLPASTSAGYAVFENLLIWLGSQALWLASAYSLELHTIESPQFARAVWILLWLASVFFFSCNVFLLRRLIRWSDAVNHGEDDAQPSADWEQKKEQ